MRLFPSTVCSVLLFLLTEISAEGIGKAWRVLPYKNDYWNYPSWPRLGSSAFEVRTVSGVGRIDPFESLPKSRELTKINTEEANSIPTLEEHSFPFDLFRRYDQAIDDPSEDPRKTLDATESDSRIADKILKTGIKMTILQPEDDDDIVEATIEDHSKLLAAPRVRREADNETKMEKIATTKNVREVRMNSPETWSTQPISVEFRHRASLDQMIQQAEEDDDSSSMRSHQAPRADFVTSHYHRRSYENREPRDMPVTRNYGEYDGQPWYRNVVREREYNDLPSYRRGLGYYYPDRYRTERDYYTHTPKEQNSYYYDRYRDDDLDLYGRGRPTPKPKRIIYYATLPEIVRKPVDLRNYPRSFDGTIRPSVSRDGSYKRIPGNVDPSRFRYKNLYDGYDSYSKRSSFFDRPYNYPELESRRKVAVAESLRNNESFDQNNDRKLVNQISARNDGQLPWPVLIGTEVSVKEDERIPGRKIFGENGGYERFQNAQLQKAPDATGSSELQSDN